MKQVSVQLLAVLFPVSWSSYSILLILISSLVFQLSKLKSDLNDALYSDKWTPDAYLVAKSYATDDVPTNTRCVKHPHSRFYKKYEIQWLQFFPDIIHQQADLFHD